MDIAEGLEGQVLSVVHTATRGVSSVEWSEWAEWAEWVEWVEWMAQDGWIDNSEP